MRSLILTAAVLAIIPTSALAQTLSIDLPGNLILPNYDRVAIGQREGLEGGAFVARTDDAAANWYNPAGLALSRTSGINASGNSDEWVNLSLEGDQGRSTKASRFNAVGTLFSGVLGDPIIKSDRWRLGFAWTHPVSWQPGVIDAAFETPSGTGTERFAYTSEVQLAQSIGSLSLGYAARKTWRLGFGAGLSFMNLSQRSSISDRYLTSDSAVTLSRDFSADGSVSHLLFQAGGQWDMTPRVTMGVAVMTPGIAFGGNSQLSYQASRASGTESADLYFRDELGKFEYELPLRLDGGLSYRFDHSAIEADVRYRGATPSFPLYSSDAIGRVTQVLGAGLPTVGTVGFNDVNEQGQAVTNLALGGHIELRRWLTLHGGFSLDQSPVKDSGSTFTKLDLAGGTLGLSGTVQGLTGSVGVGYANGRSDPALVGTMFNGQNVETRLKVSTISLLFAASYSFPGGAAK